MPKNKKHGSVVAKTQFQQKFNPQLFDSIFFPKNKLNRENLC